MEDLPLKSAKILVVDDQEQNVLLLEEILRDSGYVNIRCLTDSAKVLERFAESPPDLILLDLHMVPLSGFAVMAQLRPFIPEDDYLPILVLTGDLSLEARRRALSMGAADFVAKPFSSIEVLLRINNLLQTRFLYLEKQNQNQLLEQRVQERTAELERARLDVVERLARIAEFRDDQTHQHTVRVGEGVVPLARALGLPEEEVELIHRAAPLHDIGKIGIPDAILLKPGRLTEEEVLAMQHHTTEGAAILSGGQSRLVQLAEQLALTHHERWDGTGYPSGLALTDIPLVSRIVSIVDVFDALTHARPYKLAWPVDRAIAEIAALRGRQFDPAVVDAFLSLNLSSGVPQAASPPRGGGTDSSPARVGSSCR